MENKQVIHTPNTSSNSTTEGKRPAPILGYLVEWCVDCAATAIFRCFVGFFLPFTYEIMRLWKERKTYTNKNKKEKKEGRKEERAEY